MTNKSELIFLFAHGAGGDMDSEWMVSMDNLLSERKIQVVRFNFPYMIKRAEDGKRRPPDRQPKLLEAFKAEIESLPEDVKIVIGGKSMGGRMASLLACDPEYSDRIASVVCMGYPFHPPGKPEKFKGEHLASITVPTLILQGERDTFGTRDEMADWEFSDKVKQCFLPDGDHSFKPRKKSGLTLEENMERAANAIASFISET